MGTYLSDYDCASRLVVSEKLLEKFKAAAAGCVHCLEWKEGDQRIGHAGQGLLLVEPLCDGFREGEGWFTGEWSHDWDEYAEGIIELCEAGSFIDVYVDDYWEYHRFVKTQEGTVSHDILPVANPFRQMAKTSR